VCILVSVTSLYPPDEEVIKSAAAAVEDIRGHIDHQSKDAESVDTKGTAILTVTIAAATIVASRVSTLDTDAKRLPAIVTLAVIGVLVVCLFQALRPRDAFSYGPDPRSMVKLVDRESHKTTMLWIVDSLVASREMNVRFLDAKAGWYQRALRAMVAAGLSVAWMIQTGAIT